MSRRIEQIGTSTGEDLKTEGKKNNEPGSEGEGSLGARRTLHWMKNQYWQT
jgi:hypothetical protein